VDFRAFDTLGELTALGAAGIAIAALLYSRRPTPVRSSRLLRGTPLSDAAHNSVFVRTVARVLVPAIVILSVVLLVRGHQEPGGGFIAALIGGAGFALLYLAAPSESAARIRWPFLALIGAGIVVGTGTGLLGYFDGSFLRPLSIDILGPRDQAHHRPRVRRGRLPRRRRRRADRAEPPRPAAPHRTGGGRIRAGSDTRPESETRPCLEKGGLAMTVALTAGILVAGAVYLFLQREMLRVILGFILLGNAANLVLLAAGGTARRGEPFGTPADPSTIADPLPQAFVLTAIVIAFSITIFMLVLAVTGDNDDDTSDGTEPEDDDEPAEDDGVHPDEVIAAERGITS